MSPDQFPKKKRLRKFWNKFSDDKNSTEESFPFLTTMIPHKALLRPYLLSGGVALGGTLGFSWQSSDLMNTFLSLWNAFFVPDLSAWWVVGTYIYHVYTIYINMKSKGHFVKYVRSHHNKEMTIKHVCRQLAKHCGKKNCSIAPFRSPPCVMHPRSQLAVVPENLPLLAKPPQECPKHVVCIQSNYLYIIISNVSKQINYHQLSVLYDLNLSYNPASRNPSGIALASLAAAFSYICSLKSLRACPR